MTETSFESFLQNQTEAAWAAVVSKLLPDVHEVDRNALQIWFAFFPLKLWRVLREAADPAELERKLLLQGNYHLRDQVDSSHTFLYGHRYWPAVKRAVEGYAAAFQANEASDLEASIREAAQSASLEAKADESLTLGITAVAFMTWLQAGGDAFKAAPGRVLLDEKHARLSPERILKDQAKDDSQGMFGFLRSVNKMWTITFDEGDDSARFKLINGQDLAWAAAADKRDYKAQDERRIEGPIPVECRNASCGTCWVGVLGGAEKLAPVSQRERRMMREFGYADTEEERPVVRLACITPASGAVSIVIPPWNGFFGKFLQKQREMSAEEEAAATETTA